MTFEEYKRSVISMFPKGPFWDYVIPKLETINIFAEWAVKVEQILLQIQKEMDPRNATENFLLPFWEEMYGTDSSKELEIRRKQVYALLTQQGGQSKKFYKSFLKSLGYDADPEDYTPFVAGSKAGKKLTNGEAWRHRWAVVFNNVPTVRFTAGSLAGERLRSPAIGFLENILQKMKPAHTELLIGVKNVSNPR